MEKETIIVNGTIYDATTGMPIGEQPQESAVTFQSKVRTAAPSHAVHKRTDAPRTASRRAPVAATTNETLIQKRVTPQRTPAATQSPAITRFTPQPSKAMHRPRMMNDIRPAAAHPIAEKTQQRIEQHAAIRQQSAPAAIKPSTILKQEAIAEAMSKAPEHRSAAKPMKRARRSPRMLSFASAALSGLLS